MKRSGNLKRRAVLVALAAAPAISCSGRRAGSRYVVLTDSEALALAAICDRLIPPDRYPGASQAGVLDFFDRQLMRRYREHRRLYTTGLAAVDLTAGLRHGRRFAELAPDAQDALLGEFERNQGPREAWGDASPKQFFETVLSHTMQGFYGSPRHGGNRDGASWKMLGVANPPVRGRPHYEVS